MKRMMVVAIMAILLGGLSSIPVSAQTPGQYVAYGAYQAVMNRIFGESRVIPKGVQVQYMDIYSINPDGSQSYIGPVEGVWPVKDPRLFGKLRSITGSGAENFTTSKKDKVGNFLSAKGAEYGHLDQTEGDYAIDGVGVRIMAKNGDPTYCYVDLADMEEGTHGIVANGKISGGLIDTLLSRRTPTVTTDGSIHSCTGYAYPHDRAVDFVSFYTWLAQTETDHGKGAPIVVKQRSYQDSPLSADTNQAPQDPNKGSAGAVSWEYSRTPDSKNGYPSGSLTIVSAEEFKYHFSFQQKVSRVDTSAGKAKAEDDCTCSVDSATGKYIVIFPIEKGMTVVVTDSAEEITYDDQGAVPGDKQ